MVSASLGSFGLCVSGIMPWSGYFNSWVTWWLGDSLGVLAISPVLLVWSGRPRLWRNWKRWAEMLVWLAILLAVAWLSGSKFLGPNLTSSLAYLPFPLLIWAAMRFTMVGATMAVVFICVLAVWATTLGVGPMPREQLSNQFILLWAYLSVVSASALLLAAAAAERRRDRHELAEHRDHLASRVEERTRELAAANRQALQEREQFRTLVEESPLGVAHVDSKGNYLYLNPRFTRMTGYDLADLPNVLAWFDLAFPDPGLRNKIIRVWKSDLERAGVGTVRPRIFPVTCQDGSQRIIQFSPVTLNDQSQVIFYQDVTNQERVQSALRASEEKFRALFEDAAVGIVMGPLDNLRGQTLTQTNKAFQDFIGYSADELANLTIADISHPDDMPRDWRNLEGLRDGLHSSYTSRKRYIRKDGQVVWGQLTVNALRGEDGAIAHRVSMITDITAAVEAEQGLKLSEEKFAKVFQHSPLWVVLSDPDSGRYIEVNDQFLKTTGFSRQEVIGRTSVELGIWASEKDREEVIRRVNAGQPVRELEVERRGKDGRVLTMLLSSEIIEVSGEKLLLSISQDITDRKVAEEGLAKSEQRYRSLFENASDGIFIVEDDLFLDCNLSTLQLFGCAREEILGHHPGEFSPPTQPGGGDSWELAREKMQLAMAGQPQRFHWRHWRLDRSEFDAEVSLSRVEIGGKNYLFAFLRDISEREAARRALEKSEEKFSKLFMASPAWIALSTLDEGRYLETNQAVETVTGYIREEILGRTSVEMGFWVEPGKRHEAIDKLKSQGRLQNFPISCKVKNGEIRHLLWSAEEVEVDGVACAMNVFLDVTERRRAEEALRESQEKFSTLYMINPLWLAVTTWGEGVFWR